MSADLSEEQHIARYVRERRRVYALRTQIRQMNRALATSQAQRGLAFAEVRQWRDMYWGVVQKRNSPPEPHSKREPWILSLGTCLAVFVIAGAFAVLNAFTRHYLLSAICLAVALLEIALMVRATSRLDRGA